MSLVEGVWVTDEHVEIVLDLPFPPSTNRIWRNWRGRVARSREYLAWIVAADKTVVASRQFPKQKIRGKFCVDIALANGRRGDGDNRIKAVMDWCQSREVIRNDSDCRDGRWHWVDAAEAPKGCRVTLRSMNGSAL